MQHSISVDILKPKWIRLLSQLSEVFGHDLDLQGILFLIGVEELGLGKKNYSKDEKQDLMHIATCRLLSMQGFYELDKIDDDGWPHYKAKAKLPKMPLKEQDVLLKQCVIEYFIIKGIFAG